MTVQAIDSDTETLHKLGYAQELLRRMGGFSNFAVSFTIISILSGCLTAYGVAMFNGGPIDMNIGWPLVGIMVIIVGLAMAEVCSSYPTAGGLYYWSAKLGGKNGPAWSWFTGWFNLVGQVAVTAGIDGGLGLFASAFLNNWFGYPLDPPHILLVFAIALVIHGSAEHVRHRLVALLNDISVWWHIVGVVVIVAFLLIAPEAPPVRLVHLHELQQRDRCVFPGERRLRLPDRIAARAVHVHWVRRVSAHDRGDQERGDGGSTRHRDVDRRVARRRMDSAHRRHIGDPELRHRIARRSCPPRRSSSTPSVAATGQFLLFIAIGAQFYCGMSSITANSRMIYAFSRDGAVPGHQLWSQDQQAHAHTNQLDLAGSRRGLRPVRAVSASTRRRTSRSSPSRSSACTSHMAFRSSCGSARVDLRARAVEPRRVEPSDRHDRGHLDRDHQHPVHPADDLSDLDARNFNYTIVAFAVVLGATSIWWFVSAKNWFKGPKIQGTAEELASIEAEFVGHSGRRLRFRQADRLRHQACSRPLSREHAKDSNMSKPRIGVTCSPLPRTRLLRALSPRGRGRRRRTGHARPGA